MSDEPEEIITEEAAELLGLPTLTAISQRAVDFYGDNLVAVQAEGGIYVPVKQICQALGIDWDSQRKRIMRDEVLSSVTVIMTATGSDGKRYEMVCLPDDMLHGWLFGVSTERIKAENREQLLRYKRECYRRLHASFTGGEAAATGGEARLAAIEARLAALEGAQRGQRALPATHSGRMLPAKAHSGGGGRTVYRRITERITEMVELVDIPESPLTAAIVAALQQAARPLRPREVTALLQHAGLKVVPVQVSRILWNLEQSGRVQRSGRGAYEATGSEGS